MLAALALYLPFYYYAPFYRELYTHVVLFKVNWWFRWTFGQHNGIQIYIAYVLMFMAIGLTAFFEYLYLSFVPSPARWAALAICSAGCIFYLGSIGFFPPMASIRVNGQGVLFITGAVTSAFICGHSFDRKWVKALLLLLLFCVCMVPTMWTFLCPDYMYFFAPALRILKGCALNQTYFQYDHCLSFLAMAWLKLGLPLDRFHVIIEFSYVAFFVGAFIMAKNFLIDKQLAFYFVFSLVLIKAYGNLGPLFNCPQVSPLRLDLWLVLLGLAYWKGPQHWSLGFALGAFLNFHHTFGVIYCLSYFILVFTILIINFSKETFKTYIPNSCMIIAGGLINRFFISSNSAIPALNYVKYNIGFMPIDPKSFFWYVPVIVSAAFLLLWKNRKNLAQRYFQTGLFLVFLAIGNLLYFFGRSHENNLINIAAVLWLVFFMLIDLIIYRLPKRFAEIINKIFIPLAGVFIVGAVAYFYSGQAVDRIKIQAANLPKIAQLFQADKKVDLDFNEIRKVTGASPNIIFLSIVHDFEYYYYGGYTPVDFCPLESNIFKKDIQDTINDRISKGAYVIVPKDEYNNLIETIIFLNAKYKFRFNDFALYSNNIPAS